MENIIIELTMHRNRDIHICGKGEKNDAHGKAEICT